MSTGSMKEPPCQGLPSRLQNTKHNLGTAESFKKSTEALSIGMDCFGGYHSTILVICYPETHQHRCSDNNHKSKEHRYKITHLICHFGFPKMSFSAPESSVAHPLSSETRDSERNQPAKLRDKPGVITLVASGPHNNHRVLRRILLENASESNLIPRGHRKLGQPVQRVTPSGLTLPKTASAVKITNMPLNHR